jgi:hypothetical protein
VRNTYRNQTACSIALAVLATIGVAAQDKPDFSGRWVLATRQPDGDVPLAFSVRQTLAQATMPDGAARSFFRDISITREFRTTTASDIYQIGVIGGSVPGHRVGEAPTDPIRHHGVTWDGNALVFEGGSHTGQARETGVWTEWREVWTLDADGSLRVVITTRSSDADPKNVTLLYRRS